MTDLTIEHMQALFRVATTPDLHYRETHVMGELARLGLIAVGPKHVVNGRHQADRWITAAGVRCLQAYLKTVKVSDA